MCFVPVAVAPFTKKSVPVKADLHFDQMCHLRAKQIFIAHSAPNVLKCKYLCYEIQSAGHF